jgi:Domain of unknown function (DUF4437)
VARPHIEFIESGQVPFEPVAAGPLAQTSRRLLSEDNETGSWTAIVRFPAGFSTDLGALGRPVELFGLQGQIEVDGTALGEGMYAYVPSGGARPVEAEGGADVLMMVEPEAPPSEDAVEVTDTSTMRWSAPGLDADVPPGIVIKLLRVDPDTGDWTWVAGVAPGWQEERAEIHPTVEECLMLRGDILLGTRGTMTAGSYFWRPGMVEHGPMFSRDGGLFFFRTKGGSMDVTHVPVPGWKALVDEYVGREPYFAANLD